MVEGGGFLKYDVKVDRQDIEVAPRNTERKGELARSVFVTLGGMNESTWRDLPIEEKTKLFDRWKGNLGDLEDGDYLWLARNDSGFMLMDNLYRVEPKIQIAIADELLKDFGGQLKLNAYLQCFDGLESRHMLNLIEASPLFLPKVIRYLDDFKSPDYEKLKDTTLLNRRGDLILSNFDKFKGHIKLDEVVDRMISMKQFDGILKSSYKFDQDTNLRDIEERIYVAGGGKELLGHLGRNGRDQTALINRLVADGRIKEIAKGLGSIREKLDGEVAMAIIDSGDVSAFVRAKEKFVNLDKERVLKALKEKGGLAAILEMADDLGITDHSGLVVEMLGMGMEMETLAANLDYLRGLDSKIMNKFIKSQDRLGQVLGHLSSFSDINYEAGMALMELVRDAGDEFGREPDWIYYGDLCRSLDKDVSLDQRWELGKISGLDDAGVLTVWIRQSRYSDIEKLLEIRPEIRKEMLEDQGWIKRSRPLLWHYKKLGEYSQIDSFIRLVKSVSPDVASKIEDDFGIKDDVDRPKEFMTSVEWYGEMILEPMIYKFYLEEMIKVEVSRRFMGKSPWGNPEEKEFSNLGDRIDFEQLEATSNILFGFVRNYIVKAVNHELKHQKQYMNNWAFYVEDLDPVSFVQEADSSEIRNYFVRATRSFRSDWMTGGFGGHPWSEVAKLGRWIWTGEASDKKRFFVDRAIDMQHNFGHIFDKDKAKIKYDENRLKVMLEFKKECDDVDEMLAFGLEHEYITENDVRGYLLRMKRLSKAGVRVKLGGE